MNITLTRCVLAGALLAAGTISAGAEAAKSPRQKFIVGGVKAKEGELPWQVALIRSSSPETARWQFCGGSLIGERWVLTAAHCIDNEIVMNKASRLDIVTGTLKYASGGERLKTEKIIVHPQWSANNFDHDAALVKLASPAKLGKPVPFAASDSDIGSDVRVSGWGATAESAPGSEDLLRVDVPVVTNETCNKPDSYNGDITNLMFCAGKEAGGMDSCQGDSGGPAVAELNSQATLVGVVSWGIGCARPLKYGVYTRVPAISKWISDTMAAN